MYKISIYGCAMFKKLVCHWVNVLSHFVAAIQVPSHHSLNNMIHIQVQRKMYGQTYRRCIHITRTWVFWSMVSKLCPPDDHRTHSPSTL